MSLNSYTAFGDRVILEPLVEQFETSIVIPETRSVSYMIGRALAVGKKAEEAIKVGDIYMFQVAMDPRTGAPMVPTHGAADNQVLAQHWRDLIAVVSRTVINTETFNVVGHWILIEPEIRANTSLIQVPETAQQDPSTVKFKVAQIAMPYEGLEVGDEVIVDRSRCNPFSLKQPGSTSKGYYYVDRQFVYGVVNPKAVRPAAAKE